jgi:hypothetical protein
VDPDLPSEIDDHPHPESILKKSIQVIKDRASHQATLRHSKAYSHVKSKVARCLKVQNKVAKNSKKKRVEEILKQSSEKAHINH